MNSLIPNQELIKQNRKVFHAWSRALDTMKVMQLAWSNTVMNAFILYLLQWMFNAWGASRAVCLEAALSTHIHRGTASGFWMKVNLKILKTVSKSLGNKADNLVLNSDESSSVSPSVWAEFRNYFRAEATPGFTYCTSSWKTRVRWLNGWSSTMIGLAQNTYSWMIMSTLIHQSSRQCNCILQIVYCTWIFKETVALYAYFSTSIHVKSCDTEIWMTIFSVNTIDFSSFSSW